MTAVGPASLGATTAISVLLGSGTWLYSHPRVRNILKEDLFILQQRMDAVMHAQSLTLSSSLLQPHHYHIGQIAVAAVILTILIVLVISYFLADRSTPPGLVATSGTLQLMKLRAHKLKNIETGNGKSDPFVVVTVGRKNSRTSTQKDTLDPVWEETLSLPLNAKDPKARTVRFEVRAEWTPLGNSLHTSFHSKPLGFIEKSVTNFMYEAGRPLKVRMSLHSDLSGGADSESEIEFEYVFIPDGRMALKRKQ
mmetsp:Transcript_62120/g.134874  ORF Transcript_62120/g.134874 Transcript_62120/m.134874 type:complete len:252 (+) Transcript_62120:96-851(+)|eukprot:CAMPEP_0170626316 /NCGR_PEP_ID=MMETSP0224-20130122/31287_1 /TAXON_ID=285029 /ORGANISM="Togula jolla, Strain CCCM 725" /LENGTH=251 /DNA_ID=CAMNT_0010953069 /DNA_START=44 /DNA_END=799 /DNA_ORIENTATION=-